MSAAWPVGAAAYFAVLVTLAVPVKVVLNGRLSLRVALFDIDPAGMGRGDDTDPRRIRGTGMVGRVSYDVRRIARRLLRNRFRDVEIGFAQAPRGLVIPFPEGVFRKRYQVPRKLR